MDFSKINNLFEEHEIPECVKKILIVCGYDTIASLRNLKYGSILAIERHMRLYFHETIQELTCCHSNFYKQQNQFEFLPGHRELILENIGL